MPPKKQQEIPSTPYIPITVLPIFSTIAPRQAFKKPVTIKQNIDINRITQILKDKGLENYKTAGQLNEQGVKFICQNLSNVFQEVCNIVKKPPVADPKKDAKKDNKKDAKKEQVPIQQPQKPLQIAYEKNCSDFYVILDYPKNPQQLQIAISKGLNIDIVVIIKQQILQQSRKPNYDLLNKQRTINDFQRMMEATQNQNKQSKQTHAHDKNKIHEFLRKFKQIRRKYTEKQLAIQNSIILEIPYMLDLSNPDKNHERFLIDFFKRLCEITIKKTQYKDWKQKVKTVPMIEPIRQTIQKQVQVQEKKDDKKGAKKDSKAQTKTQIITQTIQTPYESLIQNRQSNLRHYNRIKQLSTETKQPINDILTTLILSIDEQLQSTQPIESSKITQISKQLENNFVNKPINKINPVNLSLKKRNIRSPEEFGMNYQLQLNYPQSDDNISLKEMCYNTDNINTLKTQFVINHFESIVKKQQPKFKWDFSDRKYVQKLSKDQFWSRVNSVLLKDPKIFKASLKKDNIKFIIMSQINPPGRVLFNTCKLQCKTLPNFEYWLNAKKIQKQEFYNYSYQRAGNLALLTKNMMPSDNNIIRDQIITIGDQKNNIITIQTNTNTMGIKQINNSKIYWFKNCSLNLQLKSFHQTMSKITYIQKQFQNENGERYVKQEQNQSNQSIFSVAKWIRNQKFTLGLEPYPTIFYHGLNSQLKRKITCKGIITKYMHNGSIIIYYPNGNISQYHCNKWIKIVNNVMQSQQPKQIKNMNFQNKIDGQKRIRIRDDQTIFIAHPNGQQQIIFPDGTQIVNNKKQISITNPQNIIIRVTFANDSDENIIGYGSAFAYLGFENILERSCNGYLFQVFHPTFSTHLYLQKFQQDNHTYEEQITLVQLEDCTFKINNSGKIVYIGKKQMENRGKNTPRVLADHSTLNQRWLQLFTTIDNHKCGVYDIDLKQASIMTTDSQSNTFKVTVGKESQVKIAVSFKINDTNQQQQIEKSGFYIPELNYFLPPPTNSLPSRLFLIHNNEYFEYLNKQIIKEFNGYQKKLYEDKNVIEFTYLDKKQNIPLRSTFTLPVNLSSFCIPDCLTSPKTVVNLVRNSYEDIYHRVVEQLIWDSNYSNLKTVSEKVNKNHEQRKAFMDKLK